MLKHIQSHSSALLLLLILIVNCSIGPNSGIETGNPKIIASVKSAFNQFSKERWNPAEYLITGESQLNPDASNTPIIKLAKRAAGSDSTEIADTNRAETDTLKTIKIIDSIILVDSIHLHDTLDNYSDSVKIAADSTVTVIKMFSVVLDCSIEYRDTLVMRSNDAIKVPSSYDYKIIPTPADTPLMNIKVTSRSPGGDTVTKVVVISQNKLTIDTSMTEVNRISAIGNGMLTEVYMDRDGDGKLGLYNTPSGSIINLAALYSSSDSSINLVVDFDAGIDGSFQVTRDNRIHSLQRIKSYRNVIFEEVDYHREKVTTGDDTLSLTVSEAGNDSVESIVNKYICISGTDKLDHRQNRLTAIHSQVLYHNANVKKITTSLYPDQPLSLEQKPQSAKLSITYDFGKGLQGILDGTLDYGTHRFTGTYAEGGVEYTISYDEISGDFKQEAVEE